MPSQDPAHDQPAEPREPGLVPQRLSTNRANPYFKPLGYSQAGERPPGFANTPCSAGITATLPPRAQAVSDPNFQLYATTGAPRSRDPGNLYDRIKAYAFGLPLSAGATNTNTVPAPPCVRQGKFRSIGRSPESTPYLHVRRQP